MHWQRSREALYDADELARARKKRGLPDYEARRAPRPKPPAVTCAAEGCTAAVHYSGALCTSCRVAQTMREEAEKAARAARRKEGIRRRGMMRPPAKKVRCTVCNGPMKSTQAQGKYPCHKACRPYLLDVVEEREAA